VSVVTFDTAITYYTISQNEEISVLQVGDILDPFVPLPLAKLSYDVRADKDKLELLIDKIYNMYSSETVSAQKNQRTINQVCTGAAIAACS